jgi:predicted extracellular nuclease
MTLLISEILYDPNSAEDDWEWIEVYNSGASTIDFSATNYVVDDINGVAHGAANITSGTILPGQTGILFNVDDLTAANFELAWGSGLNLIPVTNWSAMALNNSGDQVGLWDSFASYSGDNATHANAVNTVDYNSTGFPDPVGASIFLTNLAADNTDGNNWSTSTNGGATPAGTGKTSANAGGNVGGEIASPDGISGSPDLLISEVMYDPNSAEDDWEWVEVYNAGGAAVDFSVTNYVIDDINGVAHGAANITSGTILPGATGVLFNVDDISAANFEAAWGAGLNLIPVTNWSAMALNNSGDQVSLWDDFADYSGDNTTHTNATDTVNYADAAFPDPVGASIFLSNLAADNNDGANWDTSTDGGATPAGTGRISNNAGGNGGTDVGSPGGSTAATPGVTITESGGSTDVSETGPSTDTYEIALDTTPAGNVEITVTADAQTEVSSNGVNFFSSVALNFADTTPATITVRAIDDATVESPIHTSTISHAVTTTADPTDYPLSTTIADVVANVTDNDGAGATFIHDIQGSGSSATPGTFTIDAIVTGVFNGSPGLGGFYVQEEDADADADPATSEGIFVVSSTTVNEGDRVEITGTVQENGSDPSFGQAVISPGTVNIISSGNPLPTPTVVQLPIANQAFLERFEAMLVEVQPASGDLTVTEHFNFDRFGEVLLSSGGRLAQFTELNAPSVAGFTAHLADVESRTILIDDGRNGQNNFPIPNARGGNNLTPSNTLRGGDTVDMVTGILGFGFSEYRVQPTEPIDYQATNPRPNVAPAVGGEIKVAAFNVLNYFNGDGMGGGFPTPRGATTFSDFQRQRDKTIAAILNLDADIVSLIEIENDGFGANSAIQDLVDGLNAVAGAGTYDFVDPGVAQVGTDAIAVGLIYKPAVVTESGTAAILDTPAGTFQGPNTNRASLAQSFTAVADGEELTVAVNHFKSKGGTGTGADADQGDGQGNWNQRRTDAANALTAWLATDPTGSGDPDFLITGDLNAYKQEDPVQAILGAGFVNLIPNDYSYVFDGQWGTLDYAIASTSLANQFLAGGKYHINADEPDALDYSTEFNDPSLYAPDEFRASDHDPLLVSFNLSSTNVITGNGRILGTAGDNLILGGAGVDRINALAGDDTLVGGGNLDIMAGGDGVDVFRYDAFSDSIASSRDRIADFDQTEGDRFNFSFGNPTMLFNAGVVSGANLNAAAANAFIDKDQAMGGNQALFANEATFFNFNGSTYLVADNGNGTFDAAGDLLVQVGPPTMPASFASAGTLNLVDYFV